MTVDNNFQRIVERAITVCVTVAFAHCFCHSSLASRNFVRLGSLASASFCRVRYTRRAGYVGVRLTRCDIAGKWDDVVVLLIASFN